MDIKERWYLFFNRTVPNLVLRIIIMVIGISFIGLAIALTRATGLGTSPISCVPVTISYIFPQVSLGTFVFILNTIFVITEIILLRRDFKPIQLLQLPATLIFAAMVDVFVPFCEMIPMPNYFVCLLWNCVGCVSIAFGVFLTVKASLLTLPGEGIVLAIAKVTKAPFPKVKTIFDASNAGIAIIISLIVLGGLYGVREGTLISACSGMVVAVFNRLMPNFEFFCPTKGHITLTATTLDGTEEEPECAPSKTNGTPSPSTSQTGAGAQAESTNASFATTNQAEVPLVITISRQYGSGGRTIGLLVGKLLGIKVYDESLIELTARESGLTPEYVRDHGETLKRGLLYNLYMQNYEFIGKQHRETDTLFLAQAHVITKLASEGSCVIVGRCANSILAERPNVFNVYVHAPLKLRVEHVMHREHLPYEKALDTIQRVDKERAAHSKVYTDATWGNSNNYHLTLDSSIAKPEDIARMICAIATHAPVKARISKTHTAKTVKKDKTKQAHKH